MGKKQAIPKYYTLEELSQVYYKDYQGANADAAKVLNGVKKYPHGFHSEEEANALNSGEWKKYLKENICHEAIDADAIVYADGSLDEKVLKGSYGLIIFFKTGEVFYESAFLEDTATKEYKVIRYGTNGEQEELNYKYEDIFENKNVEEKEHGYISASGQIGGECDGVRRALEICLEKKLKKVHIFYDCDTGAKVFQNENANTDANVTYAFAELGKKMRKEGVDVRWEHVYSHAGSSTKSHIEQYPVKSRLYLHSVYNDIVDAMAKAEILNKDIAIAENFNLSRALLPDGIVSFGNMGLKTQAERRNHIRRYLEIIVDDEVLRPTFKA